MEEIIPREPQSAADYDDRTTAAVKPSSDVPDMRPTSTRERMPVLARGPLESGTFTPGAPAAASPR